MEVYQEWSLSHICNLIQAAILAIPSFINSSMVQSLHISAAVVKIFFLFCFIFLSLSLELHNFDLERLERKIKEGKYEDKEKAHRTFPGHSAGVYRVKMKPGRFQVNYNLIVIQTNII